MPTLCFGGSFNPIHDGHLRCAQVVAEKGGYERVLLIPSARPPHKPDPADLAPAADRLAMCRLAAADRPLFAVSDIETRRGGPSYTIETAQELRRQGFSTINWLIGADMLLYLPKWHRVSELLREVHFVVMARPGWTIDWERLPGAFRHLRNHVVEAPLIDISATEIRRRVREGLPIEHLTPVAVAKYIHEHGLYRGQALAP
jgi:nicotinate-nucleotide adenylyltransferase